MRAKHNDCLIPDSTSRLDYLCYRDCHFCVLADESAVLGVCSCTEKVIYKEPAFGDSAAKAQAFDTQFNKIFTLVLDEPKNALFAGGIQAGRGMVAQIDLERGRLVRKYAGVESEILNASARLGRLLFFGGWNSFKVLVIDSVARRVAQPRLDTAIKNVISVAVCAARRESAGLRFLLTVSGVLPNYTEQASDVFDITDLIDKYSVSTDKAVEDK